MPAQPIERLGPFQSLGPGHEEESLAIGRPSRTRIEIAPRPEMVDGLIDPVGRDREWTIGANRPSTGSARIRRQDVLDLLLCLLKREARSERLVHDSLEGIPKRGRKGRAQDDSALDRVEAWNHAAIRLVLRTAFDLPVDDSGLAESDRQGIDRRLRSDTAIAGEDPLHGGCHGWRD